METEGQSRAKGPAADRRLTPCRRCCAPSVLSSIKNKAG
jgi:hypothetical protein